MQAMVPPSRTQLILVSSVRRDPLRSFEASFHHIIGKELRAEDIGGKTVSRS